MSRGLRGGGRGCVQPNNKSRQGGGDLIQFLSDVMQGLVEVAQMCSLESHCPVEGLSLLCQVHSWPDYTVRVRQREAEAECKSIQGLFRGRQAGTGRKEQAGRQRQESEARVRAKVQLFICDLVYNPAKTERAGQGL